MKTYANSNSAGSRPRILIIDTHVAQHATVKLLGDAYEIIFSDSFESGFLLAREYVPALIIVSSSTIGNDLKGRLKKVYRTSRIPVLAILQKEGMSEAPFVAGAWDDFIQSPFEAHELLLRVSMALCNRTHIQERFINFDPEQPGLCTENFLTQIKTLVEKNLDNNQFGVGDLARQAAVSQPQLYRKLIALTGFAPNEYIRHIRLRHAARLLREGAGNVGEVAARVGFNSQSYFTKCFTAVHHYRPKQLIVPGVATRSAISLRPN